jgi:ankyrin repeat protein
MEENILSLTINSKIAKVERFINDNGDLNSQDELGNNALIIASQYGNLEIAKLLIESKKINVDLQNKKGNTALILASFLGYSQIAKLLIEAGADRDIQDKDGKAALDYAKQYHHNQIIKLLTN